MRIILNIKTLVRGLKINNKWLTISLKVYRLTDIQKFIKDTL